VKAALDFADAGSIVKAFCQDLRRQLFSQSGNSGYNRP
jgi:hypothetical protein